MPLPDSVRCLPPWSHTPSGCLRRPRPRVPAPTHAPAGEVTPFSLFEDDNARRFYAALGLGTRVRFRLVKRALVLIFVTYVPMALLALVQGLVDTAATPTNFFADFAAYAQFLIALPLYMIAEPIIDSSTREAAKQFLACGIVRPEDAPNVQEIHATIAHARKARWPDIACIGFVSEAQGRYALFILAFGIGNVAAPVGYQIAVLNYDLSILPVWGPLVLFGLGAPVLFTLPLFMFTKQLYRSKKRAIAAYRERVTEQSRKVEQHWLFDVRREAPAEDIRELAELETLGSIFTRIEKMRVVPFDLRSFGQLVGSSLGAIATLLPLLYEKGELSAILEALGRIIGHASGG